MVAALEVSHGRAGVAGPAGAGDWEGFEDAEMTAEEAGDDVFGAPAPGLVLRLEPKAGHRRRC
jgi:hypothetical protein